MCGLRRQCHKQPRLCNLQSVKVERIDGESGKIGLMACIGASCRSLRRMSLYALWDFSELLAGLFVHGFVHSGSIRGWVPDAGCGP